MSALTFFCMQPFSCHASIACTRLYDLLSPPPPPPPPIVVLCSASDSCLSYISARTCPFVYTYYSLRPLLISRSLVLLSSVLYSHLLFVLIFFYLHFACISICLFEGKVLLGCCTDCCMYSIYRAHAHRHSLVLLSCVIISRI